MAESKKRGGARPGSGPKNRPKTSSISMRLNKEALEICRNYYKGKFSSIINEYVKKLAKKLEKNT